VPSIEVVPPVKVVLTPVEVQTFDVTVSAPNPVVQVVSEGPQGPSGDAATVDVGTVTVVNPDVPPDVVNSGTTADAVLDFDLPRAAAVSVGTTTTVGPADPAAVTDSGTDGDVVLDFDIPQGVQGDQGVEISAVEPENLTVLWADTSEEGDAVLPLGGAAGQSLVKVSGDDYDTHRLMSSRSSKTQGPAFWKRKTTRQPMSPWQLRVFREHLPSRSRVRFLLWQTCFGEIVLRLVLGE
jgi:hypothetical protein